MKRRFTNSISKALRLVVLSVVILFAAVNAHAQITVTATAGTLGPTVYTQLRLAFNAINAGTHQGAITISVTAGTFETASAVLNQNALPASYTSVLIKPAVGTTPIIQGNIVGSGVINLFGASNVTIDGSNTVGGTTRDLTIQSTNGTFASTTAGVRLSSAAAVGVSNITVKNCKVFCQTTGVGMCITSGSGTVIYQIGTASHNNVTIQNNQFQNGQLAIYGFGPATLDNGWIVTENDCATHGFEGIHLNNATGYSITKNNIGNVTVFGNGRMSGIVLSNANNGTTSGNKINTVTHTIAGWGTSGIYVNGGTGVSIFNNFISGVSGLGSGVIAQNAHGIYVDLATSVNINHNTINMNASSTGAPTDAAICFNTFATAGSINLRNNIFVNTQTTGNRYAIYSTSPSTVFATIDYNDYFASSGNLGFIGGIARTTIAQIQAGFGSNLNSLTLNPLFISPTDLHLQTVALNLPLAAGTPIVGITTDIDGANRSLTSPTIGAHEMINKITYTPRSGSCNTTFDTLSPVTIESPVGVPTTGGLVPRIYFRKGAAPWFSTAGTLLTGTGTMGTWRFIVDASLMGGVSSGDIISYFVVAQTTGGVVFANPTDAGFAAIDVNTITTPPATPNTYTNNSVELLGLVTSQQVCFNSTIPQTRPFAYTGTLGAPNQYMLTWIPGAPVPVPAFVALPAGAINVTIPAATSSLVSTGTLIVRNSVTGCASTRFLTFTIDSLPNPITGPTAYCTGVTATLSSVTTPGTWSSSAPAVATINPTTGVVSPLTTGATTITYTVATGCSTFVGINVVATPGPITGVFSTCVGQTTTLSNATPGGVWSSSNPGVASIHPSTGVVTGGTVTGASSATIFYTIAGCSAPPVTVTVDTLPGAISGTPFLSACPGESDTLRTSSASVPAGLWSSSAPGIASIGSTSGIFTAISGGIAVISYRFTSTGCVRTNTLNIFTPPGPIMGNSVVCMGLSTTLTNSVTGGTWSSTLPGIISVSTTPTFDGDALGVALGTSTITYTLPTGCKTTRVMTVSNPPTSIGGTQVLCSGYTVTLTNGTPGGTWTSADPTIATVGASTGVVTGIVGGVTTISYTTTACNPVLYTVTINQTPPPITGGITICDGGSTTALFNATPGGVWTISGPASISPSGVVTGLTIGASNVVSYTMANGCYVVAPIIVDTLPAPITGIDSICQGRSTTLSTAATGGLWSSNNAVIASVVDITGVVTGVNFGSTTITYAALSGCYRTKPFSVINPLPASVSMSRTPATAQLCLGVPVTFTAVPVNGGLTPQYQWQNFGVDIPGATNSTLTYTPTHGDVIRVYMTNSLDICAAPTPAHTDMPINIYPNIAPVVNITTTTFTTNDGVRTFATMGYLGQVVTFNSVLTSGGTSPSYQWYVDGDAIPGATDNSFVRTVYDNDVVHCVVNGNPICPTGSIGTSNKIYLDADYLQTNTIADINGSLSLFPNPNTGSFTLNGTTTSNNSELLTIEVINVLGQVVYKGNTLTKNGVINHQVNLSKETAAGTYVLRVNSETENKVFHFVIGE